MREFYLIPAEQLRSFGERVLQKGGVPREDAKMVAAILVEANLRGVDTHGIYFVNLYARRLQKGLINPSPRFRFEKKRAGVGMMERGRDAVRLGVSEADKVPW